MSERNPAIDPRPGDELRGDPWRYRVLAHEYGEVRYEMIPNSDFKRGHWGHECTVTVSLFGWRDMAVGLTVEKVA